ncbi:MAG: response regulator transcription factor [Mucilaginibacter sp.]
MLILFSLPGIYQLDNSISKDTWIGGFSLLFLVIGMVISRKLFTRTITITTSQPDTLNYDQLLKAGISKREADILLLINDGLSNQQIADKLFISENTIKKHISNIFQKLQVERRTEAIRKARELSAIV